MSHIMIQNAGELPLWGMRLLGLSNKSEAQIGQFGTGLKESIALLVRMGSPPIIFSGENRIEFSTKRLHEQDEICFRMTHTKGAFERDQWHGLGMHPNFGHKDWIDPWMVFREVFCNAMDASGKDFLHHKMTEEHPDGKAGCTRVYIPTDGEQEIMTGYVLCLQRLLFLKKRETWGMISEVDQIASVKVIDFARATEAEIKKVRETVIHGTAGRVVKKIAKEPVNLFHKKVWLQTGPSGQNSIYDYELDHVKLTESRSVDWAMAQEQTGEVLYNCDDPDVLREIVAVLSTEGFKGFVSDENRDTIYEYQVLCNGMCNSFWNYKSKRVGKREGQNEVSPWRTAWKAVYGEEAYAVSSEMLYEKVKHNGRTPIIVEGGALYFLKHVGIPCAEEILSEDDVSFMDVITGSGLDVKWFEPCWKMYQELGLVKSKTQPPVKVYQDVKGKSEKRMGCIRHGDIYLNIDCIGSNVEKETCIELIGQYLSGCDDSTRAFQNYLVHMVDKLHFGGVKS